MARFTLSIVQSLTLHLPMLALLLPTLAVPVLAFADEDAPKSGWGEAFDGKGEFGYFEKWFLTDGCAKNGLANCKDFKAAIKGKEKWPAALIAEALVPEEKSRALTSTACVEAWGCRTMVPALEMIGLRGDPGDKAALETLLKLDERWKKNWDTSRPLIFRIAAWYGDKSLAPLLKKLVSFDVGMEYTNLTVVAAVGLFSQWGDNSLIDTCQEVINGDADGRAIEDARAACGWYLARFGDKSTVGKLKRVKAGNEYSTQLLRAAMGDASDKAEWAKDLKQWEKDLGRVERAVDLAALAMLGDAKAEAGYLAGLSGGEDQAFESARILATIFGQPLAKKAVAAAKKGIAKLSNKDRAGRAKALEVAFVLRSGDASVLKDARALFASDDKAVRELFAKALAGTDRVSYVALADNGAGGGAPVAGLGAILEEAWSNETDNSTKGEIAYAWAALRGSGGN